jgi:hypothetical protein
MLRVAKGRTRSNPNLLAGYAYSALFAEKPEERQERERLSRDG